MQTGKSIFLLLVTVICIFPWQLVCLVHPTGHNHKYDPQHLTPCELRKKFGGEGVHYFPPMHCHKLSIAMDDYQAPETNALKTPPVAALVFVAVVFEIIVLPQPDKFIPHPPEPKCRSATILPVNTLRGPPLV